MLQRTKSVGFFCVAMWGGAMRCHAQATAAVVGTVTDMSGAAIAEATVQVKNSGTGVVRATTADSRGASTMARRRSAARRGLPMRV